MRGPINPTYGLRLAELRQHAGLSLSELAAKVGVAKSTVSRYERGLIAIPAERLWALAAALGFDRRFAAMPPGARLPPTKQRPRKVPSGIA